MRPNKIPVILTLIAVSLIGIPSFSQVQAQRRIPLQVIVNGQVVNAVYVMGAGGAEQTHSCFNPQQYATLDGATQGWACYDQTTGVWLLNAQPPAEGQQPVPQPQTQQPLVAPQQAPTVVYPQQSPIIIYPQQTPTVVYLPQTPIVIYQQPQAVIYQQPGTIFYPPTALYLQAPRRVIYANPTRLVRPLVLAPAYPSSSVLGTAAIGAARRVAPAAVVANGRRQVQYAPVHWRR